MDLEPGKLYRFKSRGFYYIRDSEGKTKSGMATFEENDFCFILSCHHVTFTSKDVYRILMKNEIYYIALNLEDLEEI
jgi:hypothetical protein